MAKHHKFWIKYILDFMIGILVCATYPGLKKMGGQNFKLFGLHIWLQIRNPHEKLVNGSVSFLNIPSGTPSKMASKLFDLVLYIEKGGTYLFFETGNSILTVFPSEF